MARFLLALLVVINLTLVCWGHDEDGHHTGVHLTFLGEPEHDEDTSAIAEHPIADGEMRHASPDQPSHSKLVLASTCATIAFSENSLPDGHAVSTLGLALVPIVALTRASSLQWFTDWSGLHSQTTVQPPSP